MFCLRCPKKVKKLVESAAEISGLSVSSIMRNSASWFASGRIELIDSGILIAVDKNKTNVIKIKLRGIYYGSQNAVLVADMRNVIPPPSVVFRKILSGVATMIVDHNRCRIERLRRLDALGRAGVDYNVPDSILEKRDKYGVVGQHDQK